jgi:Na+-transporting NADH:ubiquinone oxidoreductase subunit F
MCGPPQMNSAVSDLLYNMGVPEEMIDFDDFG